MNYNLNKLKQVLADSPEVAAAYLFGSAAKNEPVVNDLDILILLYPDVNPYHAYLELSYRIGQSQNINADKVDLVFFDLDMVDPEVLYEAVNHGILLKNNSPELLTDKIEELSNYFLENESLMKQAKKLRREFIKKNTQHEARRIENYLHKISFETNTIKARLQSDDDSIIQSSIIIRSYKYAIIVIVETIVQLLQYILAMRFNTYVNRYKEILIISKRYKIIRSELSNKLEQLIELRNMLIHPSRQVDDGLFLKNLRDGLDDFQKFVSNIKAFIQEHSQKPSDPD
jgi:uncharacterized protein YutE (UPF0331/DUF86 family)/predicted nucleotidyltransferase